MIEKADRKHQILELFQFPICVRFVVLPISKLGRIKDISMVEARGGKSISYSMTFRLENHKEFYNFRDMPNDFLENPGDYFSDHDKIGILYSEENDDYGRKRVYAIKNFTKEQYFYADVRGMVVLFVALSTLIPGMFYFILGPEIRMKLSSHNGMIFLFFLIVFYVFIPLLFAYAAYRNMRIRDAIKQLEWH